MPPHMLCQVEFIIAQECIITIAKTAKEPCRQRSCWIDPVLTSRRIYMKKILIQQPSFGSAKGTCTTDSFSWGPLPHIL